MNYKVEVKNFISVDEVKEHWTEIDYKSLLELFDVDGVETNDINELREYLYMAINDCEPSDAAEIVLSYRLGDVLNIGQIQNISHEMLNDKVAEEYPDISMQSQLFQINELLYKAYNGKFPHSMASQIDFELLPTQHSDEVVDETLVLRCLSHGLNEHCILSRLFEEQLRGEKEFLEAKNVVWSLKTTGENSYQLLTSEYWISKEDFNTFNFEAILN